MKEKIKEYFDSNKKIAFLVTLIGGLIAHFSCYAYQIATTDCYCSNSGEVSDWGLRLGRWGGEILELLKFHINWDFLEIIFTLIFLVFSTVIIIDVLNIQKKFVVCCISILIVVSPFVTESVLYRNTCFTIAMFFSMLAIKCIYERKNSKYIVLGVFFTIISCSLYQAYISLISGFLIFLYLFDFIQNKTNIKETLKEFVFSIILFGIGLVIYYIITVIILKLTGLEFADYGGANSSIVDLILSLRYKIAYTYTDFYKYYFKDDIVNNSEYYRNIVFAIIFITFIVNILIYLIKNKNVKFKNIIFICAMLMISPIFICSIELIMDFSMFPLMTASLIIPLIFYLKLIDMYEFPKKYCIVCIALIIYVIYTYLFMSEATYMTLQTNYEQVYARLIRMVDRIETTEDYSNGMPILFIGYDEYTNYLKIYDYSNGDFDRLGVFRSVSNAVYSGLLKNKFGMNVYVIDSEEVMDEIMETEEYSEMEEWPSLNSVKVINDIMVVKCN